MQTTGPRPTLLTKDLKRMSAPPPRIEPTGTITLQRPITWKLDIQRICLTIFLLPSWRVKLTLEGKAPAQNEVSRPE